MISPEERKDILDDELEILVERGWIVVSRTGRDYTILDKAISLIYHSTDSPAAL